MPRQTRTTAPGNAESKTELRFTVDADVFVRKLRRKTPRAKKTKKALRRAREVQREELERVVTI